MNETSSIRRAAAAVAWLIALGALLLAVAHLGIDVPVLSSLGPQGGAVPPAVVAFTIATIAFGAVAVGVARGHRSAVILGLVLSALSIASGLRQFRGVASGVGMALALVLGVLLLPLLRSSRDRRSPDPGVPAGE